MRIEAKILADSISEKGDRITTYLLTFPRIILAEFNTHRAFSRNSASSRAIPFKKMVESVEKNPFIPIAWQKDHKGMQGTEYLSDVPAGVSDKEFAIDMWLEARDAAVGNAKILNDTGVTKQLCNRLLEPFMWHTVIVTATEWENFFALRCPQYQNTKYLGSKAPLFRSKKDYLNHYEEESDTTFINWYKRNKGQAEIHMMALAEAMWDAYNESTPKELKAGEWHIPFGNDINKMNDNWSAWGDLTKKEVKLKIATAMCARVSYTVVGEEGKEPNYENDVKLHDRLIDSNHWSPLEHCARVMSESEYRKNKYSRNFKGFVQYRAMVEGRGY